VPQDRLARANEISMKQGDFTVLKRNEFWSRVFTFVPTATKDGWRGDRREGIPYRDRLPDRERRAALDFAFHDCVRPAYGAPHLSQRPATRYPCQPLRWVAFLGQPVSWEVTPAATFANAAIAASRVTL
jgi:hypothetical protein